MFFSFQGPSFTKEPHPFTLCNHPKDSHISILVKNRGDFTRSLHQHLKVGDLVHLDGPYGRFDYTKMGQPQIWVAGGIGIAPFIAWTKHLTATKHLNTIDLFYCVHKKEDAVFLDAFHRISKEFPQFHISLFCSEENQRLTAKRIQESSSAFHESSILMCGPKRMTYDLYKQFRHLGVQRKNIIFEDFEFF